MRYGSRLKTETENGVFLVRFGNGTVFRYGAAFFFKSQSRKPYGSVWFGAVRFDAVRYGTVRS